LSAADHDAERASFGGTRSAADRCVEIRDTRGSEAIGYAHGGGLIDRRKIDAQKIALGSCGNGLGRQKQQFRIFRRYAATAQRIDMADQIRQVLDANRPFAGEKGALGGIAAENRNGMPRAEQATHDWRSHVSKADESYAQSCVSPWYRCRGFLYYFDYTLLPIGMSKAQSSAHHIKNVWHRASDRACVECAFRNALQAWRDFSRNCLRSRLFESLSPRQFHGGSD
jgi:hypothetical protein